MYLPQSGFHSAEGRSEARRAKRLNHCPGFCCCLFYLHLRSKIQRKKPAAIPIENYNQKESQPECLTTPNPTPSA
jgi:hypothetical protein